MTSGLDTTLQGAELAGNRVEMNTGRDLTISSVQDRASYDSRQSSSGANLSLCVPPLCYGASSDSVSASGGNITQHGRSVSNQSGIYAGEGDSGLTEWDDLVISALKGNVSVAAEATFLCAQESRGKKSTAILLPF